MASQECRPRFGARQLSKLGRPLGASPFCWQERVFRTYSDFVVMGIDFHEKNL